MPSRSAVHGAVEPASAIEGSVTSPCAVPFSRDALPHPKVNLTSSKLDHISHPEELPEAERPEEGFT